MELPYRAKSALDRLDFESDSSSGQNSNEEDEGRSENRLYSGYQGPLREQGSHATAEGTSNGSSSYSTSYVSLRTIHRYLVLLVPPLLLLVRNFVDLASITR